MYFEVSLVESFNHKNIKCRKRKVVSRIVITFIVERDGSLTNITAEGDYVKFMEEAITSVKRVEDKWFTKFNQFPACSDKDFRNAHNHEF